MEFNFAVNFLTRFVFTKQLLAARFEGVTGALFLKIRKFRRIEGGAAQNPKAGKRLWELVVSLMESALNNSKASLAEVHG